MVNGNNTMVTGHKRRLFIGMTHTATVGIKANVLMPLKNAAQLKRNGGLMQQIISIVSTAWATETLRAAG